MRRGQSTLEYALLIGIAAVGLIAMLIYISRGHQGNLRSQADQLSTGQYAPGKTIIHNRQSKILNSVAKAGSSTTVQHGNMNEENTALKEAQANIALTWDKIYPLYQKYEVELKTQALAGAVAVRAGNFQWQPPADCKDESGQSISPPVSCLENIGGENGELAKNSDLLEQYQTAYNDASENWPERTQDTTISSGSFSSEEGQTVTDKDTSETLGDL